MRKEPCEDWTDDVLDRFLEDNKTYHEGSILAPIPERMRLTIYPVAEWAEKVKRNYIKELGS